MEIHNCIDMYLKPLNTPNFFTKNRFFQGSHSHCKTHSRNIQKNLSTSATRTSLPHPTAHSSQLPDHRTAPDEEYVAQKSPAAAEKGCGRIQRKGKTRVQAQDRRRLGR